MKVILKSDIKGVGKKDQVINASDGYARNYLFPKNLAVPADKENMTKLNTKQKANEYKKSVELEEAKKLSEKISKLNLIIKIKAGENGKIFGSVTAKEISENLKNTHKIDIDKKKIELKEPIKSLGSFNVSIKLYENVITKLKVDIIAE